MSGPALLKTDGRSRARRRKTWRWPALIVGAACLIVAVLAYGIYSRARTEAILARTADEEAIPQVTLISPMQGPRTRPLVLPGDVEAWYGAPIYAQVSGYVKMWYKDYGAPVKSGELLATIETPALDERYAQAQSALRVAQTDYDLAALTARRWRALLVSHSVSVQVTDEKEAAAKAQKARVDAAAQVVTRYAAMENFKRITAPFDGVVTARDTDVGDYVNATGGDAGYPGHSSAMFQVADIHTMRVFVSVPQDYSAFLGPAVTATLTMSQFPGKTFTAKVSTTAKSFNAASRTVLTELLLPNPKGAFWPGTYATVRFAVPTNPDILVIPEQALLFRAQGLQVCLVGADQKVHLQTVTVGLNFGSTVQVLSGLKANDRLIANPSDGLLEGETVQVTKAPPASADDEAAPPR